MWRLLEVGEEQRAGDEILDIFTERWIRIVAPFGLVRKGDFPIRRRYKNVVEAIVDVGERAATVVVDQDVRVKQKGVANAF